MREVPVGEALRRWREARGLSLRRLAARAGVDYTSIVRIEGGRMSPTVDLLGRLAEALGTTVPGLFVPPPRGARRRMRKGERP